MLYRFFSNIGRLTWMQLFLVGLFGKKITCILFLQRLLFSKDKAFFSLQYIFLIKSRNIYAQGWYLIQWYMYLLFFSFLCRHWEDICCYECTSTLFCEGEMLYQVEDTACFQSLFWPEPACCRTQTWILNRFTLCPWLCQNINMYFGTWYINIRREYCRAAAERIWKPYLAGC